MRSGGAAPGRRRRSRTLSVFGSVLALAAGVAIAVAAQSWYLKREVVDGPAFTQRAANVVAEPQVQSAVSTDISEVLATKTGISVADVGPAVSRAMQGRSFDVLLRAGAKSFNAALFHDALHGQSLSLSLRGLVETKAIPAGVLNDTSVELVSTRARSALRDTNDAADVLRVLCTGLPLFALIGLGLGLVFARRRSRALSAAAFAIAVVGAASLPVLSHLRDRTIHTLRFSRKLDPRQDAAIAKAIWTGFFGPMHAVALVSRAAGGAVAVGLMLWSARPRRAGSASAY